MVRIGRKDVEMKRSTLFRLTGAAILSLSLAVMPLTVSFAQTDNPDRANTNTPRVQDTRAEHPFDWGWLGLLGLAGLLGLLPRNDRARHRVAVDAAGRTTARP
jgi:hypothetical protein